MTSATFDPQPGLKLFPSEALAQTFVRRCLRIRRFNYFVGFRNADPARSYGVSVGWAAWAGERPYVKDVFPGIVH